MTTSENLLRAAGINLPSHQPGRHYTTCPKCSHARKPAHRATKCLGVTIHPDGSVSWGCNHCNWTGPEKGSGDKPELTTYEYRDAEGTPRFRKVRNLPGRE